MFSSTNSDHFVITFEKKVNVIRCLDSTLYPSTIDVSTEFQVVSEIDDSKLALIIGKLDYFFDYILENTVMISDDDESLKSVYIGENGYIKGYNNILLTPGDPVDALLAVVLQAKMTAISENCLEFVSVKVGSTNSKGLSTTFLGLGHDHLPSNEDWIGSKSWFNTPWWDRNDATTMDATKSDNCDLLTAPFYRNFDFVDEIIQDMESGTEVIELANFKPTLVDDEE